jgi:septal ring factor EnvC (AmiA/AmiB activator)
VVQAHDEAKPRLSPQNARRDTISHQIEQLHTLVREGRVTDKVRAALAQLEPELSELPVSLAETRHTVHELRDRLEAASEAIAVVEDTIFKNVYIAFGKKEYRSPDRGKRQTILATRGPT